MQQAMTRRQHPNAPLTPVGRLRMVRVVCDEGCDNGGLLPVQGPGPSPAPSTASATRGPSPTSPRPTAKHRTLPPNPRR
jgi:hypothetical protein